MENNMQDYQFISSIKNLPFVEAIYLFGSRAQGVADDKSDIDLAINCPQASTEDWNNIIEFIDNAPILEHIDAVRYDTLTDCLLKQQIDKYKQVIYAKN